MPQVRCSGTCQNVLIRAADFGLVRHATALIELVKTTIKPSAAWSCAQQSQAIVREILGDANGWKIAVRGRTIARQRKRTAVPSDRFDSAVEIGMCQMLKFIGNDRRAVLSDKQRQARFHDIRFMLGHSEKSC